MTASAPVAASLKIVSATTVEAMTSTTTEVVSTVMEMVPAVEI